jgi:hypothetical protein
MEKDKISILLLDDQKIHFGTIKTIVQKIIQQDCGKTAEFIYTYDENKKITKLQSRNGYYHYSKFGGSENVKNSNLQKLKKLLNKIQTPESVIAIIDINWDETNDANRYGRQFYEDHLQNIPRENIIFISFIKEENLGTDLTLGFKYAYKNEIDENGNKIELSEPFKKRMRALICNIKVSNKMQTTDLVHTNTEQKKNKSETIGAI